jgi:hypothetical protein
MPILLALFYQLTMIEGRKFKATTSAIRLLAFPKNAAYTHKHYNNENDRTNAPGHNGYAKQRKCSTDQRSSLDMAGTDARSHAPNCEL